MSAVADSAREARGLRWGLLGVCGFRLTAILGKHISPSTLVTALVVVAIVALGRRAPIARAL